MRSIGLIGSLVALAVSAPLAAQSNKFRTDDVLSSGSSVQNQQGRATSKVPPGQLPPAGMCRIWIDGVPPGQQPAPTDCQTAVANKPANARILWGDQASHPGKGKVKSKKAQDLQTGQTTTARGNNGRGNDDANDDNDDDDRGSARSSRSSVINSGVADNSRGKSLKSKKGKGHGDD
jgi:hypothetical protein